MEKVLNINLGNQVFTIEEQAYFRLHNYLEQLKKRFEGAEGAEEMLNDIEIRLGEMLEERLAGARRNVVSMADVEAVQERMGKPSDFEAEESGDAKKRNTENKSGRRLYRDPDNKRLGGVASGIAAYFDIDPVWIRLALILAFLFSAGTLFLIYAILWIIVPEAITPAEKMEMRGEAINLENFERNFKEEMHRVKSDFKEYYHKEGKHKARKFSRQVGAFVEESTRYAASFLGKSAGTALIVLSAFFVLILIYNLIFSGSKGVNEFLQALYAGDWLSEWIVPGLTLLIAVPLVRMMIEGFKLVLGIRHKPKPLKYTLNFLSSISFIFLVYAGFYLYHQFGNQGQQKKYFPISQTVNDSLVVRISTDDYFTRWDHNVTLNKNELFYANDNQTRFGRIKLEINPSDGDSSYLFIHASAYGETTAEARKLARNIHFDLQYTNHLLTIPNFGYYLPTDPWRDQEIRISLFLPKGKRIYLPANLDEIEHEYDVATKHDGPWIMTNQGLKYEQDFRSENQASGADS